MLHRSWKRKFLSEKAEIQIQQRVAQFEEATGSELKIAVGFESHHYPEAPLLLAFMLSGLMSFMFLAWSYWGNPLQAISTKYPVTEVQFLVFLQFVALGLGEVLGRFAFFKRLVLSKHVTAYAVKHQAFSLFHQLHVHETENRVGIFLMFSLLERRIELMVDKGLSTKMNQDELRFIVREIESHFKEAQFENGLLSAIEMIEARVTELFPELKTRSASTNEISNRIHWVAR